jgi:dTDP-4-amino-4,6-dideoxygalactose transaminase
LENKINYKLPDWNSFVKMVDGIWDREYYTNHGPLVVELESKLAGFLEVKHAICMTNESIATMISILALESKGKAILPVLSHVNLAQSVIWAGLDVDFCDIKVNHPTIDIEDLKRNSKDVGLVIAINPFGDASDVELLENFCSENEFKLIFISSSVFGQKYLGKKFGSFGNLEIFSFHESQFMNGSDGACVTTNDDVLAARLRNIRSSYGAGKSVPIPFTGNGRMSEIQAGLILLSMNELEKRRIVNLDNLITLTKKFDKYFSFFEPSSKISDRNFSEILCFVKMQNEENSVDKFNNTTENQIKVNNFINYGLNPCSLQPLIGFSNLIKFKEKACYFNCSQMSLSQLSN